MKSYPYPVKEG